MTTITFNPTTTAQFAHWGNANIWSPKVVPDGSDVDVVVPTIYYNGSPYFYYLQVDTNTSYSIRSLSVANPNVLIVVGTLIASGDINSQGEVQVEFGTLDAATLEVGSLLQGSDGAINVTGALTVGGNLAAEGLTLSAGALSVSGKIDAFGNSSTSAITVAPGGFSGYSDDTLTGGTLEADSEATLQMNVGGLLTTDAGTLILAGGRIEFFDAMTSSYVSITSSLQTIANTGVLELMPGAGYTQQFGALSDNGEILLKNVTSYTPTDLHIGAGGELVSAGDDDAFNPTQVTINGSIVNDGVIVVQAAISDDEYLQAEGVQVIVEQTVTGSGYFAFGPPASEGYVSSVNYGVLEFTGAQSQNVVFTEGAGTVQLDDPTSYTGAFETLSPKHSDFDVDLRGVNYDDVTGYAYSGDSASGELVIHTTSGDYTLNFIGQFDQGDFTLSAVQQGLSTLPPMLQVEVQTHQGVGPLVLGLTAQETYVGATSIDPLAEARVLGTGEMTARIALSGPQAGVLALANASSYGVTDVSYNATTGIFVMEGTAAELTAAMRALTYTPSFANVAAGFARPTTLSVYISGGGPSQAATTQLLDYNGVSIASALAGRADGFTSIYDTAADLEALTAGQISQLASDGVTRLVSSDASVIYSATQSAAILTSHLTLGAPANDSVTENFPNETIRTDFNSQGFFADRVITPRA